MNKYNLALFLLVLVAHSSADDRVKIKMDTTEAESVVAVLHKRAAGKIIDSADWKRIFDSTPYIRLKKREASMHRDFTDDDFKKFVLSEEDALQLETQRLEGCRGSGDPLPA